ncbi:peptidyl-prolyl cis-trans isomerase [Ruficoccus amylovorans]|uniref:Peptidyl-prolyl cis-trans isomerase n=1 Tax=Ruficoccus amylovorans TaxID=1804625 RepID=A0A842HD60_9BACT|nr:peptidylprolyl isomerase [Ruficoccus amylovorans]MBC2594433.1 peptidyl-prolyl cis-trans isomerase [Ruficoccus amylovorans]
MISWIQTIIQRHHKWFFGALLIVIIVAFVFTVGATPGIGSSNRSDYTRNFLGFNLSSQQVQQQLARGVELSFILSNRNPSQINFEAAMKQRAVMLYLADTLEIPEPTEAQLMSFIQTRPAFIDPQTGVFSNNIYTSFVDNVSNSDRYDQQTVVAILTQDWRIDRAAEAVSGPGYVLPYLAERQEEQTRTTWSVETATMNAGGFKTTVTPTEDALKTFFEQAGERYKLPPQMTINYVAFPAADYLSEVSTPTDEELDAFYIRNISKWEKNADGSAKPLEEVRDAVAQAWKQPQAARKAAEAASQLTVKIYNAYTAKKIDAGEEALTAFIKDAGYKVQETPSFSVGSLPQDFPLPAQAAEAAEALTDRRLYSDAIVGPDGAYVVLRGQQTPATMPELDAVRERVVADYTAVETNRAFTEFGEQIHSQLQQAVDEGGSFSAVARKAGFEPKSFTDFTIMDIPEGLPQYYFYQLMDMKQGEVSPMLRYGPDAVFLYVQKKEKPAIDAKADDLQETLRTLSFYYSGATAQGIIRDLVAVGDKMATPEEF